MIEDYRPLAESLGWQLAALNWLRLGVLPFIAGDVPFIVNNNGRLSTDAAALVFANCREAEPQGSRIAVLELGAGTGLFARYFLDEFRLLCRRESRDYYDRLSYFLTDASEQTVEYWRQAEIFREHEDHVVMRVCDANEPAGAGAGPFRAVFCNYVLDSLPAAILRRNHGQWEQCCGRTWITDDAGLLRQYTRLSLDDLRRLASSNAAGDREQILAILPLLEMENSFLPVGSSAPPGMEKLATTESEEAFTYNFGALVCLDGMLALLEPQGLVLINDYGNTREGDTVEPSPGGQRFGPCTAIGLYFPLLDEHLRRAGVSVLRAEGDDTCQIHARLLLRRHLPETQRVFEDRFCADARRRQDEPVEQAKAQAERGLLGEALDSYRTAIERNPGNWQLIGDAAAFVASHLRDPQTGLQLARAALELNPWCSPDLWNVLGDCLFGVGKDTEAHECYLQAHRMFPQNVRTNLNLATSWLRLGDPARSLEAIAQGLANDSTSMFRHILLDKQQEAISALCVRWNTERERAVRR
jgi:tetratricopeptide (TPR) repeat protein